ncbi:lipase, partial [Rhizobiaceae sp. 2RAB30]
GELVASVVARSDYDEVLLIGHSTGGALILDIAANALEADPALAGRKARVCVLTLGSTALKVGLHPAGTSFRRKVQTLVDDGRVDWIEIQCLTDVINFYKSDPAALMKLDPRPAGGLLPFPLVRQVRMRDMLEVATYKRIKRNFFRVHYQYIFGNTKRYFYDFFMVCCGPLPLRMRAEKSIVGADLSEESAI